MTIRVMTIKKVTIIMITITIITDKNVHNNNDNLHDSDIDVTILKMIIVVKTNTIHNHVFYTNRGFTFKYCI